jgi:tetratricopeptide (TPR) repeat protein
MAPYDGEAYFFNGLMAAKLGDTARALVLYQQSLRLKPRYLETYNQLASVYRRLGDLGSAMVYNNQALAYFPGNPRLYFGRGLIYHAWGQLDSAVAAYQETVKLQPNYYQAYFQMGLINQKYRNYYNALANYQKVQQLRPQFPRIDTYIGYCHEQMGQYDLAIAAYTKASQLNAADRQAAAGLWRSQRRQYAQNSYNSLFLPNTTTDEPITQSRSRAVLDTTRVRISTIQPKSRVTTSGGDSLRRTLRPVN